MSRKKRSQSLSTRRPAAAVNVTVSGGPSHWRTAAILALIVVATFLAYTPALNGGFIWDDDAHITKPELRSSTGLARIWFDLGATQQYYPLLHSAFWVQHKLWGDATLGYHIVNVLLHATAACLVYFVLRKLAIPGAWLAAAIFALHPVHAESVAWITEQKNTLSAVFYLSAMLAYLSFDDTRAPRFYALAIVLFVLGLLSKTVTATLPAALIVIFWWQRGQVAWRRDLLPLIPFFLLGAVAGLTTAWVERNLIGAEGADFELTFVQRGLLAGRVIWFYVGKLLWPTNLVFVYPRWEIDPTVWWQWLFPLATLATLGVLWIVRRRSRAPLAGWLLFVGTLVPVLGFLNVYPFLYSFVADHFQYLASLGLIVLAAAAIVHGMGRLQPPARAVVSGLCLLLLGTLAALTWRQSHMYRDVETLYVATLARNPACWMAHNNLGMLRAERDPRTAIDHYKQALALRPRYAEPLNNMGVALEDLGLDAAAERFRQALTLQPNYAEAHANLGRVLTTGGQFPDAIRHLETAVALEPDSAKIRAGHGDALRAAGQLAKAQHQYRIALQLNPGYVEVFNNLGILLFQSGETDKAIEKFHRALALQPDNADIRVNLANALLQVGRTRDAIVEYQAATRLLPNDRAVHVNLALACAQANRTAEAITAAERALQLARIEGKNELVAQLEALLDTLRSQPAPNSLPVPNPADAP